MQTGKQSDFLTIAITGLNAVDNPGPGIGVIRALRDAFAQIRVIGLVYEALEPGIYLHNIVDRVYNIPYPAEGPDALLQRLTYIDQKENIDIIIPNFDAELYNFVKIKPALSQLGISAFLPSITQLEAREKINLKNLGREYGFLVPDDIIAAEVNDIKKATERFGYPCVVKGRVYDALVVYNNEQALNAYHLWAAKWGAPVILQQFIKGSEINIACLTDKGCNLISAVCMRKLYITDKGKAWAGITIESDDLTELAGKFVLATKWQGSFELEVIKDETGKVFIIEVNPRFPAWIYLAAAAGNNQPAALAQMAMGHVVEPFEKYETGKMFIRYAWDNIVELSEFQQLTAFGEL